jgi:hypothetical protein
MDFARPCQLAPPESPIDDGVRDGLESRQVYSQAGALRGAGSASQLAARRLPDWLG